MQRKIIGRSTEIVAQIVRHDENRCNESTKKHDLAEGSARRQAPGLSLRKRTNPRPDILSSMHSNDAFSTSKILSRSFERQGECTSLMNMIFGTRYAYRRYGDTRFRLHFTATHRLQLFSKEGPIPMILVFHISPYCAASVSRKRCHSRMLPIGITISFFRSLSGFALLLVFSFLF